MAKRFTETNKWQDPWFRALTPTTKVFYLFLLDQVDSAGVWDRDDGLFQFLSGCPIEVDAHLDELAGRVLTLPDGKILVPKFVKFQQRGVLSDACRPHLQILKLMEKHGLEQDATGLMILPKGKQRVSTGLPKGKQRVNKPLPKGCSNSNSNSNSIVIGGNGKGGGAITIPEVLDDPSFHEAFKNYEAHRRQNNWAKLKGGSLASKFKNWAEWGLQDTVQALEVTVDQGYMGVFRPGHGSSKGPTDDDRDYENATTL